MDRKRAFTTMRDGHPRLQPRRYAADRRNATQRETRAFSAGNTPRASWLGFLVSLRDAMAQRHQRAKRKSTTVHHDSGPAPSGSAGNGRRKSTMEAGKVNRMKNNTGTDAPVARAIRSADRNVVEH
jgi:hypothetical protein